MSVEHNVYQTSKGGKVFVPLEDKARIIRCATPRFAKMLSSKYARLNASDVCDDLLNNHGREISRGTVAACKTLVKQRLCGSGMRWKDTGIKVVLSLRALVQTPSRWGQFWEKVEQYGVGSYA